MKHQPQSEGNKPGKFFRLLLAAGLATGIWQEAGGLQAAEDTNQLELIRQLQKQVEALQQKVEQLESRATNPPAAGSAPLDVKTVEGLDQKVRVLERNRELDQEAAEAKAKESAKITVGSQGFSVTSANGDFGVQLKGILQIDSRTFFEDGGTVGNDGLLLRRARPILQGTVFRDFEFNFVPDFGGTGSPQIYDAYLNYRYTPALQLRAGKFKTPIGLEHLQSDVNTAFNERSLVNDLMPNRDIGFQLHGELSGGLASYAVGIFNGTGDSRNTSNADFEDNKSFAGRIFFQPFKKSGVAVLENFGAGIAGSYESLHGQNTAGLPNTTGGSLPGYATVGQQQFFAYNPTNGAVVVAEGDHWRLSPQAYYYFGPYSLLGEYAFSDQNVRRTVAAPNVSRMLDHRAWQVTAGWVMTGEDASYGSSLVPRKPFDPRNGSWGAFQLVGRYSQLDIDSAAFPLFSDPQTSANSAQEFSVGLNWFLNRNVRVNTSFSHTRFDGAGRSIRTPPGSVTQQSENVLFTRVQLSF